ncbi:alpha/beta hydrolase family protein [Brumimicrobium aurantiacum]|uniref:S9 family peptidase n=1 Tax=Brumimicrobium aurantiacum TaxID=1737063 RepID=A0A3E1F1L5_9FLAO|nr:prolyl oligopeptidase family serine peptidase [Brumimicrobium aurantiacum]RFC55700.1 S9 family peptidase [Brumimicrobium aurantiacum]
MYLYQKLFLLGLLFFVSSKEVFAQKKIIDHTVYNEWKSLRNQEVSAKGNFVSYEINPHRGDGKLVLFDVKNNNYKEFNKGSKAQFSFNEEVLTYVVDPGFDTTRYMKLNDVKKENRTKDTLGIYFIQKDSLVFVPELIDYAIPEKGNYLAFLIEEEDVEKEEKSGFFGLFKKEVEVNNEGNTLYVIDLVSGKKEYFNNVTDFHFNKNGTHLFIVKGKKENGELVSTISLYDLKSEKGKKLVTNFTEIADYTFSDKGNEFAFMASTDSSKEIRLFDIYQWNVNKDVPNIVVPKDSSYLPEGLTPAPKGSIYFSLDESKLFFGLREMPEEEAEDTLLKSEKAVLDVWHYKNNRLQPQQLKELRRDQNRSFRSVYDLNKNSFAQLDSDTLNIRLLDQGNSNYALGYSNEQYAYANNWRFPWPNDYYRVNIENGEKELIKSKIPYSIGLNPEGSIFTYFNSEEGNFYSFNLETKVETCMTCNLQDSTINWKSDINGMPFNAGPEGSPGYLSDNEIILYSEYHIWTYDYVTSTLKPITKKEENLSNMVYRLRKMNYDSTFISFDESYIIGVDQDSKDEFVYSYVDDRLSPHLVKWFETDHKITSIIKAEESDVLTFRQMSTIDYPEIYLTNTKFENPLKISETNPQQSEYNWATVEQVEWESYNGEKLDGLLYKPEDFDSTKSYPLLVYFYEMYSDKKNYHYIPKPTASIIFATEYASAGYLVFIPDIRYEEGHPAKSAYNSIMSGTDKILELYPNVDSTRMGLQGQSWGGYQTAQLITMTDRYAAAMAGAPVSNMFSAYGGIRWGSGYNRAFQYEHTQSRIGKTIWEAPELYIENSPLFGIPNIETPLLIMHNDNDGAVPWYQGIEMFTGMKRLNKPVWMLNYNGDQHNLMDNANRMDLSIRMRQFFDYFLQGKPAPKWLIDGVPAVDKGKNYGLENYENR